MEIIQTIWTALSNENEELINILGYFLTFFEVIIGMLLFTSILDLTASIRQKFLYTILFSTFSITANIFFPPPFNVFFNLVFKLFVIRKIFKTTIFKAIIAEILPFLCFVLLEALVFKLYLAIFHISFQKVMLVPLYRIPAVLSVYIIIFILYKLSKYFNFNIKLLDNMSKRTALTLSISSLLGIVSIATQATLTTYYSDNLPLFITILSIISLLTYFVINIYSISRATELEITVKYLKEEKLHNKTLSYLYDNIRGFKHNYTNMLDTIGGYIEENDIEHLKIYYSELASECNRVTNLAVLDPKKINNPGLYNLLTSKYLRAFNLKINMDFNILADINSFDIKIYDFAKILGIFLDNAIEAAKECNEKIIHVILKKEANSNKQIIIIENTYSDKNINLSKIYEKGFSTKFNNTGLGLWEVNKIIKKYNNINLITTKNETYFRQTLEFYIF